MRGGSIVHAIECTRGGRGYPRFPLGAGLGSMSLCVSLSVSMSSIPAVVGEVEWAVRLGWFVVGLGLSSSGSLPLSPFQFRDAPCFGNLCILCRPRAWPGLESESIFTKRLKALTSALFLGVTKSSVVAGLLWVAGQVVSGSGAAQALVLGPAARSARMVALSSERSVSSSSPTSR